MKSKNVAIILAVLFGGLGWLYTYEKNKLKFWISFTILCLWVFAFFPVGLGSFPVFLIVLYINFLIHLITFVIWIWAIIDNSIKPKEYYENYEKEKNIKRT